MNPAGTEQPPASLIALRGRSEPSVLLMSSANPETHPNTHALRISPEVLQHFESGHWTLIA
jgi:hypothetical protein